MIQPTRLAKQRTFLWHALGRAGRVTTLVGVAALALAACGDNGGGIGPEVDATAPDGGQVCAPGATRCVGNGQVETCLSDGSGYGAAVSCGVGAPVCLDGACVACDPGTTICASESSLLTCLPAGGGYGPPEPCDTLTPICVDGACLACTPDTAVCTDGNSFQTCRSDGSGYAASQDCGGSTPVCLGGACVECVPDSTECADATSTHTCLSDGSGYESPVTCDVGTPACLDGACVVCSPGTVVCADNGSTHTCLSDGSGYATPVACDAGTPVCLEGTCIVCSPGSTACVDEESWHSCLPDGSGYDTAVACAVEEGCDAGACVNLCTVAEASPSSVGCSFMAAKMDNFYSNASDPAQHDLVTVTNPHPTKTLEAQLYFVAVGDTVEQAQGAPVSIPPLGFEAFILSQTEIDSVSILRAGGVYRIQTTLPAAAYHHSPRAATYTNDSMLLLPDHVLAGHYVVASFPATVGNYPSYFTAIGLVDNTTLEYTVPQATALGTGVLALAAGQTGTVTMNRYSLLNVVVSQQNGGDLSGTIISADQPIWVAGATECANVPNGSTYYCDYIAELMFPLETWGTEYVGAHSPSRSGSEHYYWRVYGGADGVTVTTDPLQAGFPVVLNKGQFIQLSTTQSVIFTGDGPFLPVQYLEGQTGGANSGDPSMILAVPTEQYLETYTFATGTGYTTHVAQVIRPAGGADVLVNGVVVTGYTTLGSFEIADHPVTEGANTATSAEPFGLSAFGYTSATSYAFPAGLRLEVINPQ